MKNKNVCVYAGNNAGVLCILTVLAKGHNIKLLIAEDEIVSKIGNEFRLPMIHKNDLNTERTYELIRKLDVDLCICCHGKKIIKYPTLYLNWINIHPCLNKFKGLYPIKKMIENGYTDYSVASHVMTDIVDGGKVLYELKDNFKADNEIEAYNRLYPLYVQTIIKTLDDEYTWLYY